LKIWTKETQTLTEFGLTRSQAKVYLALVNLGEDSKAYTVFKFSKVARQDVYRILNELQQLGLVEKVIAKPTRFRAIPLFDAASIMLERKRTICSELTIKLEELAKKTVEKNNNATIQDSDRFALITEMGAIKLRTKEAVNNSSQVMQYISPNRELSQWLVGLYEPYTQAMERGVRLKWITDEPINSEGWPRIVKAFVENPQFELRTVSSLPKAKFGIYDRKEVIMALFVDYEIGEAPALRSINDSFVSLAEEYFESTWERGIEVGVCKSHRGEPELSH
jgi:sugar-specific transcriptional regulator TrmB